MYIWTSFLGVQNTKYSNSFQTLAWSTRIEYQVIVLPKNSVHGLSGTERLRMILYAANIAILCKNIDELAAILNIYDQTFSRFGLQISYGKTETMAFNVPEDVKSKKSLFSIGNVPIKIYVLLNI